MARPLRRRLAQASPAGADGVPPSRWTLAAIRAAVPALTGYSRSGVWRVLTRAGFRLRAGRPQQFSPDPAYAEKVTRLEAVLAEAAAAPGRVAALFLDEMGDTRWPEPGPVWSPTAPAPAPVAERAGAPPRLWRLVGALNAVTGRVDTADNYIVGRRQLVDFYEQLAAAYPDADRIYVVQDNWSIHSRSCGACCATRCCASTGWPATGRRCRTGSPPSSPGSPSGRTLCCATSASVATGISPGRCERHDYRSRSSTFIRGVPRGLPRAQPAFRPSLRPSLRRRVGPVPLRGTRADALRDASPPRRSASAAPAASPSPAASSGRRR